MIRTTENQKQKGNFQNHYSVSLVLLEKRVTVNPKALVDHEPTIKN